MFIAAITKYYLRAVGILAGVGHAQDSRAGVAKLEVLVLELFSVDRLATSSVAVGKITLNESGEEGVPVSNAHKLVQYMSFTDADCIVGVGRLKMATYSLDHELL